MIIPLQYVYHPEPWIRKFVQFHYHSSSASEATIKTRYASEAQIVTDISAFSPSDIRFPHLLLLPWVFSPRMATRAAALHPFCMSCADLTEDDLLSWVKLGFLEESSSEGAGG
mmetsp:Transcript_25015/g.35267  ORF Transcript_25015/g.35267 Transcript_25015/m.35267 type:complete len:113 (+) Transcript_25015:99-437(+)